MKKLLLISLLSLTLQSVFAQTKAYKIYNAKGKKVSFEKMYKDVSKGDIILFGELHNNPISHWLQYELSLSLVKNKQVTFGAEMFERDNQEELNLYLNEEYDYNKLDSTARLWQNYTTDYAPLVNLAKKHKRPFIATNIPRRFANQVYHYGIASLDTLSDVQKTWIAPLPIAYDSLLPCYASIAKMMPGHNGEYLATAQAIKDATMAYSILENYNPESTFIHYNGAYHSNNYEGILWYLKQEKPELSYRTITTVSQKEVNKLDKENSNLADYIIVVDEDMTTTY